MYVVTIFEALRVLYNYFALAQFRNSKYLDLILEVILASFLSKKQFFMGSNSWTCKNLELKTMLALSSKVIFMTHQMFWSMIKNSS